MEKTARGLHRFVVAICLGGIVAGLSAPAHAESLMISRPMVLADLFPSVSGYDPVAHALALGLTPEAMDAQADRGLAEAERCGSDPNPDVIGCTIRTSALPMSPMS